jgi:phage shock protein E
MKRLSTLSCILISTFGFNFTACSSANMDNIKKKISENALVIDVRTTEEFSAGHYPSAVNIPVDTLEKRLHEIGPVNRAIVVYCRSGRRSAKAKSILESHGYTDITNAGAFTDMPKNK